MADKNIAIYDGPQPAAGMGEVYDPALQTGIGIDTVAVTATLAAIADTGVGTDMLTLLAMLALITDSGNGIDQTTIAATIAAIADTGTGIDQGAVTAALATIADSGTGADAATIAATIAAVVDAGAGVDLVSVGKINFFITNDRVMEPLGVIVLNLGNEDVLPGTRDFAEEVPGKDGEYDFGTEFRPRVLQLRVAKSCSKSERKDIIRLIAKYLNPKTGTKTLVYEEEIDKTYHVKYAGQIPLDKWPNYMEFVIPFKMSDPAIYATFESIHIGSGTLTNEGSEETGLTITITGAVTDPSVTVGDQTLTYTGILGIGDTLVIDTGAMTVKLNGVNALANYDQPNSKFPKLQPGDTAVTAASAGTTTFRWRDKWF